MRALGIVHAYNEADVIGTALGVLVRCSDEVHLFDHGSTDQTPSIAYQWVKRLGVRYHVLDRKEVPIKGPDGKQRPDLWQRIADFIRARADGFDWVTWIDADEIVRDPTGQLATKEAIARELDRGVQVIRPLWREFWPTCRDVDVEPHFARRLRIYRENRLTHSPRGWIPALTPKRIPIARHLQDMTERPQLVHPWYGRWPQGIKVSNNAWLLDHYPFRTPEQWRRKVMRERDWFTPRPGRHRRYEQHRHTGCRNLVLDEQRLAKGGWRKEARRLPLPEDREP